MNEKSYNLHNEAMDIAEKALIQRSSGNHSKAVKLFNDAFEKERIAAMSVARELDFEPSRSVLFRSAASMAYNAGRYRDAEVMIAMGLSGNPPEIIANELRDLYEDINFSRHLEIKGVTLDSNEYQLVISGPAVGSGIAKSDEFTKRIDAMNKITHRTVQRLNNLPYKDGGRLPESYKDRYDLFISSNYRAASFAATIRLGMPSVSKKLFPEIEYEKNVIDEIIENLDLINNKKESVLKRKINDDAYYRNFVGLSGELAPDGDNIKLVGLSAQRKDGGKKVAFSRIKKEIMPGSLSEKDETEEKPDKKMVEIKGVLTYADAEKKKIKLTTSKGERWDVIVPEGLSDIVKPYWEEMVTVWGMKSGIKKVVLENVEKCD
jgi:hypothetical protein